MITALRNWRKWVNECPEGLDPRMNMFLKVLLTALFAGSSVVVVGLLIAMILLSDP
jgi:hypothetical protein